MTTIKATCAHGCGEVALTPHDVTLQIVSNAPALSRYEFTCPQCTGLVVRPVDEFVVDLLRTAPVREVLTPLPAEALEAKSGYALSHDDLLDFALALGRCDTLAALAN